MPGHTHEVLQAWLAGDAGRLRVAKRRLPALLALAVPVKAGLVYMALAEAPGAYLAINGAALTLGLGWIAFGRLPERAKLRMLVALVVLVLLASPLLIGPEVTGVRRWLPLGPANLHAGMLTLPLLAVFAAGERNYGPPLLLTALFIALLQPDAASAFALTFACVGLHHVTQDWRWGVAAIVAFVAAIVAALRGELPAQPFADRVLVEAALVHPAAALGLFAALLAGFFLLLFAAPMSRPARFALAGTLFGFSVMALMSNYPSPLIGFGAAPILGYALALSSREEPSA